MRKCNACRGLSPLSETSCLHCGETIAVRRLSGGVVMLVAAASVTISACLLPMPEYGAAIVCDLPDGGRDERCLVEEPATDGGTGAGP